mgnify:CR=1 FL=1
MLYDCCAFDVLVELGVRVGGEAGTNAASAHQLVRPPPWSLVPVLNLKTLLSDSNSGLNLETLKFWHQF